MRASFPPEEESVVTAGFDQGMNPTTGEPVGAPIPHTTTAEVDRVCRDAAAAAPALAALPIPARAELLRAVARAMESDRGQIVAVADQETGLGATRLSGELTRTVGQLELFADAVMEGSVLEIVIDLPDPSARPAPRPDLRRMLVPLGPVAVFSASNFPLAFSVAGGDTASALAAGCPVLVKAHSGHPGLSVLCGQLVGEALTRAGAPAGSFGLVHGTDAGRALVTHPAIAAGGFTGSLTAGRALFDLASQRPDGGRPEYVGQGGVEAMALGEEQQSRLGAELPGAERERPDEVGGQFGPLRSHRAGRHHGRVQGAELAVERDRVWPLAGEVEEGPAGGQ